jgi:outer membrane protein, multidrug efflux system
MKPVLALFSAAVLAACSVGPNYHRPETEAPPVWLNTDTTFYADSAGTLADTTWWDLFGDTVLTGLVTLGLQENLDVRIAAARVEELMGRYGVTKSDFFPKVDAGGTALRGQIGYAGEAGTAERPTRDYFSVHLTAGWEIDIWGKIRRASEAAKADLLATEEARRGVVLSTISLIATSYIDLLSLDRQLEITRRTVAVRQRTLDMFQQRRAKGDLSELEYSQAESEYWYAMAKIPSLEKNIIFLENEINFLLGRNPGPIPRGRALDSLVLPEIPVGMPSVLLERRPDVRFAEEQLRGANARIGVAKSMYFPSISLSGMFGFASPDLSALLQSNSTVWNLSGGVLQPIFHWGEIKGQVKASEGVQKQALYTYVQTVRNAFREAEDALTNRSHTGNQVEAQGHRTDALTTYSQLAQMRYDEGVTSYLEVLDAERSLLAAQEDYSRSKADLYKSVVDVYRSLAGSWLDSAAIVSFQIEAVEPRYETTPSPAVPDTSAQTAPPAPAEPGK